MSIKSQKSLNDECSEIFEKSYSVKSASDESLSCPDDDECLARELLGKLSPAALSKLRRCFRKSKEKTRAKDIDRRVQEVMRVAAAEEGIEFPQPSPTPARALWLNEQGLVCALDNIFGHHKYSIHAHKLFQLLDPFNSGKIWWQQLLAKLVAVGARNTGSRADAWTPVKDKGLRRMRHSKRETIVKLVNIEREDSFCYAAVSKGGRMGIYSGDLKLLHSYEVFYHRTGLHRRVKNCWITDAIYLSDVQCLLLSASDRSLTVYDASTLTHTPVYCITGLPNIPTCLAYCPSSEVGGSSELALGTERGDVTRLRFLQPSVALFHTNTSDHVNYYFWMELPSPPHTTYCSIVTWRRVHSRSVRRLCYMRDGDIVLSCSHDNTISLRARHVDGKLDDYVFKVQRGVTCFHVVPPLHMIATGSCDGLVRLWETTQSDPFACLSAPGVSAAAVLDVAVVASSEIVIAYCNNCCVHIWDMYEECLLQTVKLKFPFLGVLGRKAEFGIFSIHPGPTRKKLTDDDLPPEEPQLIHSRRGSSVYQGSTGGLMLQPEPQPDNWETRLLEQEPEYIRFNRSELVISCCDYVCVLELGGSGMAARGTGSPLPPPGDTLRARRPSFWDLPDDVFLAPLTTKSPPCAARAAAPAAGSGVAGSQGSALHLSPSAAEHALYDLDTLLENAGLQGILEKDFVLMHGLKHDLNKKLADMKANMESMTGTVTAGAPYLALRTHEPEPMAPIDEMADTYARVMRSIHSII